MSKLRVELSWTDIPGLRDEIERLQHALDSLSARQAAHDAEWCEGRDLPRLVAQAQDVSRALSAAGIMACSLTEGVRRLVDQRDEAQQELNEHREVRAQYAPFEEWAQSYLDAGRWGEHLRADAIKTELLERDAEIERLRAWMARLCDRGTLQALRDANDRAPDCRLDAVLKEANRG